MKFIIYTTLVFAVAAQAQESEQLRPVPNLDVYRQEQRLLHPKGAPGQRPPTPTPNAQFEGVVKDMAARLSRAFQRQVDPSDQVREECGSPQRSAVLRALRTRGEFRQCLNEIERCGELSQFRDFVEGAQCAAQLYDHERAGKLYDQATAQRWKSAPDFDWGVFQAALFQCDSPHPELTSTRVQRIEHWTPHQQTIALALIERLIKGKTALASNEEISGFLSDEGTTNSLELKEVFLNASVRLAAMDYNWPLATQLLVASTARWNNPMLWYDVAYDIVYSQDAANFRLARYVYDAFRPFAHPRSRLPLEQNVFTYSELEASICKDNLLSAEARKQLRAAQEQFRNGKLSASALDSLALQLSSGRPLADTSTVRGTLALMNGDEARARQFFWGAHLACPYYNRAHWGLNLIRRGERLTSYPDSTQWIERMKRELQERKPSPALARYVLNWNAVDQTAQEATAFGSRFWRDYIGTLNDWGAKTYLKMIFELLSESPGLGDLRDVRIEYANDNRLWDDVRGAGGRTVIADVIEVEQQPLGAYNLLGHEMTHQFHDYAIDRLPLVAKCNSALYAGAKARDKFPDGYSKTNEHEYFAQGVVYNLVDEDAPARFGLTRQWLKANDPDQLAFLSSILSAAGATERISCPLR